LEEDEIVLKTKVSQVNMIKVGEREKIIVDALDGDEGSTSFH
jgi:hypothetical protein